VTFTHLTHRKRGVDFFEKTENAVFFPRQLFISLSESCPGEEILSRICPPLVTVITNHVIIIYLSTQSFSHDFSNKAIINDYFREHINAKLLNLPNVFPLELIPTGILKV